MNMKIMDKIWCMLVETWLGQEFWAEAASAATYVINRSPNSVIDYSLPEERWTGTKCDLRNLKRFGCSVFVHKIQEETSPRAIKGVFMGYPFGNKSYRVWVPESR